MGWLKKLLSPSPKRPTDRFIGRNEPCWCGSGKKYKHCHWDTDQREAAEKACGCGTTYG